MNNETVAFVDATFNNNLSLDADLGVVTERPSPIIKINIDYSGRATVTGVSTFEEFYNIVHNKQQRVVLVESQTREGDHEYIFNSCLYYTGDFYSKDVHSETQAVDIYRLSFLGVVYLLSFWSDGGYTTHNKLVEITFENSLTAQVEEVRITSANDISYYNASFPYPVPFNVKAALDSLQTNKFEKPVELIGALTAGQTTVQFISQGMSDKTIDVYVDPAFSDVVPTKTTVVGNVLTLTFPVQSTNMPVKVRLS